MQELQEEQKQESEVASDPLQEPEPERGGAVLLWSLLICMTVVQTSYFNVVALLPLYVKAHHNVFSFFELGILLGVYQISFSFAAPIAGNSLSSVGRRRMIFIGVWLMTGAVALFAAAAFFENHWVFYAISLIARLIQGGADSLLSVSMLSIAIIEWSEEAELY